MNVVPSRLSSRSRPVIVVFSHIIHREWLLNDSLQIKYQQQRNLESNETLSEVYLAVVDKVGKSVAVKSKSK